MSTNEKSPQTAISETLFAIASNLGTSSKNNQIYYQQIMSAIKANIIPEEWKTLLLNLHEKLKNDEGTDKELIRTIQTLIDMITPLAEQLVQLTATTNQLVSLQKEQNNTLNRLVDAFTENTSRIEVLTVATRGATKDEALSETYDGLKKDNISKIEIKE